MSRIGILTPVKMALGGWLGEFHAQFTPHTRAGAEWADRPLPRAIAWAPGRMVDSVDDMLTSYRKNDNASGPGKSATLPAVFIAIAPDYTESPSETGRPIDAPVDISMPGDPLSRAFRLRMMSVDLRGQVAVVTSDPDTASDILAQLALWCIARQRMSATHEFAGQDVPCAVSIVQADRMAIPTPIGEQVVILALDLTVRASLPLFDAPRDGQPTDGSAPADGTPAGFPVVLEVASAHDPEMPAATPAQSDAWDAYRRMTGAGPASEGAVVLHGVQGEGE